MPEPPAFDGSRIGPVVPDVRLFVEPHPVVVKGQPGAVTPGSLVRALNLDAVEPAVQVSSARDGSFQLTLLANVGDEVRFEAVAGGLRSAPIDVIVSQVDSEDAFEPSPRHDCVELEPGYQVPLASSGRAQWIIRNTCDDVLSLGTPRFRLTTTGTGELTLVTALPLAVPPGESASLELTSAPGATLPADQVLFIDVSLAERLIRYPFGVYPVE
jgi:hypothetical protein